MMGTLYRYGEKPSSSFLEGDYEWWNRTPEDGKRVPPHISEIELIPDLPWVNWRRQRLVPLLRYWIIPCAWSPAFFLAGMISFSLDQINEIPTELGLILMLLCPISLGISLLYFSSKSDDGNLMNMAFALISRTRLMWLILLLSVAIWLIYSNPSSTNPIWFLLAIPTVILWIEWFTLGTAAHSSPSSRWLLPVKKDSPLPMDELTKIGWKWILDTDKVKSGNFAKFNKDTDGHFLLKVIHYSGTYFLVLEWWTKFGTRTDPWLKYAPDYRFPLEKLRVSLGLNINFDKIQSLLQDYDSSIWDNCLLEWPNWSDFHAEEE